MAEVQRSALKDFLLLTDPVRWRELYAKPEVTEEDGVPIDEQDIPDLLTAFDDIIERDRVRTMNGGDVPEQGPEDGWH